MNYEKKRLKEPAISDEPGPPKHAPRPKYDTLPWGVRYEMRRNHWGHRASSYSHLCLDCSHMIDEHCLSYCESCKHECEGTEKLHAALAPLLADIQATYDALAKERK